MKRIPLFTKLFIAITILLFAIKTIKTGVSKTGMICPDLEGGINLSGKSITECSVNIDKKRDNYIFSEDDTYVEEDNYGLSSIEDDEDRSNSETFVGEDGDKKIKSDYVKFEFLVEVPEIIWCWTGSFKGQQIEVPQLDKFYIEDFDFLKGDIKDVYIRYKKGDIEYYLENGFGKQTLPETTNSKERREYPKINCAINCRFKVVLPDQGSLILEGYIKNISAGGFFIRIPRAHEVKSDDPAEVEFGLFRENLVLSGRVVRIQDSGFAVKYRNITEDIKEKITRYVG